MHWLFHVPEITTPSVVGKHIQEAFAIISSHNLNARLLEEKEDSCLPAGTVIRQTPQAGKKIKPHQSLFILLSKKPSRILAPYCLNKSEKDIVASLKQHNIRAKIYRLSSIYPQGTCFAQIPLPQEPMDDTLITLYISDGNNKPIIWPNFKDRPISEVVDFLHTHNLEATIIHEYPSSAHHVCTTCKVTDQRPLAGSLLILDPEKPTTIQLQVQQTF
jgi:hypothetical protein